MPWFDELKPGVTATAVMAQRQQMATVMGPAISSYEPKILNRTILRTINLLHDSALLPPMPDEIAKTMVLPKDLVKVSYMSAMINSMKVSKAQNSQVFISSIGSCVQLYPEVRYKVDPFNFVDELAEGLGVSSNIVRTNEEALKLQAQDEAKMKAAQEQAQMLAMAQEAMKNMGGGENVSS